MISLPPPEPAPRSQPPEAPVADTREEPQTTQEPPATEADDAGAPDSSAAPEPEEATSADSPQATEAEETPKKKRSAYRALEIAEQVAQVQEWLTMGKRPNQIRALCAEHWGLQTRAAEQRMQDARRQMVVDVDVYVRKDKAAQMIQQLEQVLEQALQMRQGSNAIGALRLQADLLQLLSRHQ